MVRGLFHSCLIVQALKTYSFAGDFTSHQLAFTASDWLIRRRLGAEVVSDQYSCRVGCVSSPE